MGLTWIQAPISLLRDPNLTPALKLLCLTVRSTPERATRRKLMTATGISRSTIGRRRSQVPALKGTDPAVVPIPNGLLADPRLRPQAKLMYGLLQTLPGFSDGSGTTTHRALAGAAGVSVVTARQTIRELVGTGWVKKEQVHQQAPFRFTLRVPDPQDSPAVWTGGTADSTNPTVRPPIGVAYAKQRLEEAHYSHEAIMKEFLTLLIDSDDYEDNARPGFLASPLSDERMELDRYYPAVLAFEFNGPQHYHTTARFPSEAALAMQQARDLMKEALCARRGVRLVILHQADLTLETMRHKVGDTLPLRDLSAHRKLARFLDKVGHASGGNEPTP